MSSSSNASTWNSKHILLNNLGNKDSVLNNLGNKHSVVVKFGQFINITKEHFL